MSNKIVSLIADKTVIPVLQIERREDAVPLAKALIEGGLDVLEVTLRSDAALAAAEDIIKAFPDAIVGIGTVLDATSLSRASDVRADFVVSPGLTDKLEHAAADVGLPFLPGVATVSEVMAAREAGFSRLKLFPAGVLGGVSMLKGLAPIFSDVKFCPTGGVSAENLSDFLALENVFAVGGSWLAPKALVEAQDWAEITKRAKAARVVMDLVR